MSHPFLSKLKAAWNPHDWRDLTVIAGVSGGADSVALLLGLANIREPGDGRLIVAHFNHGLRGAAADADERFTRDLCADLGLPLEVGRPVAPAAADTSEAQARSERYAFFERLAKASGARFAVTAHTADDQAETILHRILRGTGIGGLGGIPRTRGLAAGITMLRPLLTIRRSEVLDFLESLGQPFRQDASNLDPRFTRNRIRGELLPELIRSYNPQVSEALLRLGALAADTQGVIQALCADQLERVICLDGKSTGQVDILCQPLTRLPPAALRELFVELWKHQAWPQQEMGFEQWDQLANLLAETSVGRQTTLPGNILATRQENRLVLRRQS